MLSRHIPLCLIVQVWVAVLVRGSIGQKGPSSQKCKAEVHTCKGKGHDSTRARGTPVQGQSSQELHAQRPFGPHSRMS
jgi:hypothetical protein